jgi:protein TonB
VPFVWQADVPPPLSVVDSVEIAPVPEATAPEQASSTDAVASIEAAPPEHVEAPSAPIDQVQPPPEPVPAETPEVVTPEPSPEAVALLPLPPPPAPPPPAEAVRATPPPHPAARPQPPSPPRPAPAEAPSAAEAPAPAAPAPVVRQPPANYVGRLLAALDRHKEYPSSARFRRVEGVTLLRFAMRRDGTVASFGIERSSGHEDLDAAVIQMIQRASPLPPPPSELAGDPVELVVPVRFSLR